METTQKKQEKTGRILEHPGALCNAIKRIATEAGEFTLEYFDDAGYEGAGRKEDGSPVTEADRGAEKIIEQALRDLTPGVPIIAEEAASEGRIPDLTDAAYFWLVDPLDGTKEFISGSGDYTVNIALMHNNRPLVGVVYAPVLGELYAGHGEGTAVRLLEETGKEKSIRVRRPPEAGLTVVASASHGNAERLDAFLKNFKVAKLIKRGSSLKICSVAAGKADLYPRLGPTCEWDTAAADAVLRAAGGVIVDLKGNDLAYGKSRENFLNGEFVACPASLRDQISCSTC